MLWGHKKGWDFSLHWNCTSQWQERHVRWTSISFALLTRTLMFSPNRAILHQINISRATEIKPSLQVVLQVRSLLHRAPKISSHSILSSAGPSCPECYTKSDLPLEQLPFRKPSQWQDEPPWFLYLSTWTLSQNILVCVFGWGGITAALYFIKNVALCLQHCKPSLLFWPGWA